MKHFDGMVRGGADLVGHARRESTQRGQMLGTGGGLLGLFQSDVGFLQLRFLEGDLLSELVLSVLELSRHVLKDAIEHSHLVGACCLDPRMLEFSPGQTAGRLAQFV